MIAQKHPRSLSYVIIYIYIHIYTCVLYKKGKRKTAKHPVKLGPARRPLSCRRGFFWFAEAIDLLKSLGMCQNRYVCVCVYIGPHVTALSTKAKQCRKVDPEMYGSTSGAMTIGPTRGTKRSKGRLFKVDFVIFIHPQYKHHRKQLQPWEFLRPPAKSSTSRG